MTLEGHYVTTHDLTTAEGIRAMLNEHGKNYEAVHAEMEEFIAANRENRPALRSHLEAIDEDGEDDTLELSSWVLSALVEPDEPLPEDTKLAHEFVHLLQNDGELLHRIDALADEQLGADAAFAAGMIEIEADGSFDEIRS